MLFLFMRIVGPNFWHWLAMRWDWGGKLYVIDWIVKQRRCDAGTALLIFYAGEGAYFLGEKKSDVLSKPNAYTDLNRLICIYIANRLNSGGYRRSKIAFAPSVSNKNDYLDMERRVKALSHPSFEVTPALILSRKGKAFALEDIETVGPRATALLDEVAHIERRAMEGFPEWLRNA